MTELEQLEQQVLRLSPEDLAEFRAWFIDRTRDIKLTLSTGAERSHSIEAEALWVEEEGPIWYPLGLGEQAFE